MILQGYKVFAICLLLSGVLTACDSEPSNTLLGAWKSNAEKSLASMRSHKEIPKETRAYFENNFFGRLTLIYKDTTYSAVLEGEEGIRPDDYPYRVIEETPDYWLIENELLGAKFKKKLYKDGDCYYELTSEWHFREYFCRVK